MPSPLSTYLSLCPASPTHPLGRAGGRGAQEEEKETFSCLRTATWRGFGASKIHALPLVACWEFGRNERVAECFAAPRMMCVGSESVRDCWEDSCVGTRPPKGRDSAKASSPTLSVKTTVDPSIGTCAVFSKVVCERSVCVDKGVLRILFGLQIDVVGTENWWCLNSRVGPFGIKLIKIKGGFGS